MASSRAGRAFDSRNAAMPACVEEMAKNPPACFDAKIWRIYLDGCYRSALDTDAERARMNRGERPDYCSDCSQGYRTRMEAEGRCHPPADAAVPHKEPADAA